MIKLCSDHHHMQAEECCSFGILTEWKYYNNTNKELSISNEMDHNHNEMDPTLRVYLSTSISKDCINDIFSLSFYSTRSRPHLSSTQEESMPSNFG